MKKISLGLCLLLSTYAFSANLHYSLIKKESGKAGSTLLVIGGIHGDEPGGYFAPMLLAKHYKIESGNLWVVPNLNFDSIVKNARGINGDMNRKFAKVEPKDKDFEIVMEIKKLILQPKVDLTLNLHDGQGFYRARQINKDFNPKAWGQATIIDQQNMPHAKYGNLAEIAKKVNQETNVDLIEDVHEFNVKNTNTKAQDKAMQQSLTYFAITHNKPAFAIETSKNITELSHKVFYQLKTIEKFMDEMNIKYTRSFELSQETIKKLLSDDGMLEIPPTKITLDLSTLKPYIKFFPMSKEALVYHSTNPLVAVLKEKDEYKIMNGNILVSKLKPDFFEFEDSLKSVGLIIDGQKSSAKIGSLISAKNSFQIDPIQGYRINMIGYSKEGVTSEGGIHVTPKDFMENYAIDKDETTYMVQFYKDKKFCGMINIKFEDEKKSKK
ncbi:M99 family carboxypeptidase catalytic domain-containing protein [Sulfurospirillum multivorans]|uniref:Periplasmic peptidase n=2 Tax=Sulfurospirillum multivorans TaxID=66821 RepID=A0AA86AQ54_SULMK|nr:M99 family carboxypeptidase catalytic domain-containing protein [Sulfurospirillum multivorans]AHJ13618.1 putative periplasmic peptidase [Sulfurospirillum multivorans DSM 12446]QEH07108.1 putative periplasmic peptidase [Sulfurospirillum multivorans]